MVSMRKFLWFLLLAIPACAQVSTPGVIYVVSAPSGACYQGPPVQVLNSNGVVYTCDNGTWAAQGSGGGAPTGAAGGALSGTYPNPGVNTAYVQTFPSNANFVFDGDSRTCGVGSTSDPACSGIPYTIGTTGYAAITTGTASSGSTTLTVASASGILSGQIVTGQGIAGNTTVNGAPSGNTVTLSNATTAALSTTAVKFGNTDYASQAMTLPPFSGHGTGYNLGISGQTCAQLANRYSTDAHTYSPAVTGQPGYLSVECGTNALGPITPTATGTSGQSTITVSAVNDLDFGQAVSGTGIGSNATVAYTWNGSTTVPLTVANSGTVSGTITFLASASSIFNSIANIWSLGRADGYKIIAHTTPIFLTSLSNREIVYTYNANIRQARASYDYLADDAAVMYDPFDANYFYSDNIHYTNGGYGILAQISANALQTIGADRMEPPPQSWQIFGSGTANVRLNETAFTASNTGSNSVAGGEYAGGQCTNCATSLFLGTSAGGQATTTTDSVLFGYLAGGTETSYSSDIFIGRQAGNTATASNDVGIGSFALTSDTGGSNTCVGIGCMASATGGFSAALGQNAGSGNTTGAANTFLGQASGTTTTTGSDNVFVGENAQPSAAGDSHEIVIGQGATGVGGNTTTLGTSSTTTTVINGVLDLPVATIASGTTIAPVTPLVITSGTTSIATFTLPTGFTAGCFYLIPSGTQATTTAGNIAAVYTLTTGTLYTACYNGTKWYVK